MKQILRNSLAKGKTKHVIAELLAFTTHDSDLHDKVVQLSSRFAQYEEQKLGNLEDPSILNIELNKINQSALAIIDELGEETPPSAPVSPTNPQETKPTDNKLAFGISVGFLLLMIVITILKPEWTSQQPDFSKLFYH